MKDNHTLSKGQKILSLEELNLAIRQKKAEIQDLKTQAKNFATPQSAALDIQRARLAFLKKEADWITHFL